MTQPRVPRVAAVPIAAWALALAAALGVRGWNAFAGPLMLGYDSWGHVAYVLFLDLYGALPWADQGWSYFHPPLHYVMGWLLARGGSAEGLLRGLAVLGSLASVGIALLAAWVVRRTQPSAPAAVWLAFVSVAFLPVHLYVSPMAGNELSAAFLGSAALAFAIAAECSARAGARTRARRSSAAAGVAAGLALLTKLSGVLAVASVAAVPVLCALRQRPRGPALRSACARGALAAAIALALAAPYYARNVAEFGTPLRMSRQDSLVARIESQQRPGERGWGDFVRLSPRLLTDPDPQAPHLLHSVWGTAYVNAWADTRTVWDRVSETDRARVRAGRVALVLLGGVPTLLALVGGCLAARDARRGRRDTVYIPLLTATALTLASFAAFALRVPNFSALKASYLFALSLPYAAFLVRGLEALGVKWPRLAAAGAAAIVTAAVVAAGVHTSGLLLPRLDHSDVIAGVHLHFGQLDAARARFERNLALGTSPVTWTENLAAVELLDGRPAQARARYARALTLGGRRPFRLSALAVATALDGDLGAAEPLLDEAIERGAGVVGLVNRGALRAARGDLAGAVADLRRATESDPSLAVAWHNLAAVLEDAGEQDAAAAARREAERAAASAPRGFVYGLGESLGQGPTARLGRRFLLQLDASGARAGPALRLASPPFRGPDSDTAPARATATPA